MPISPSDVPIEKPRSLTVEEQEYLTSRIDKELEHTWSYYEQVTGREISWLVLAHETPTGLLCFDIDCRTFVIETYSKLGWCVMYTQGSSGDRYHFHLPEQFRTPRYT